MRLLQGRRRQDADRGVRAQGQALGHGRHPGRFRVRPVARRLRSFRADFGSRHGAPAGAGERGHPDLLQRPGKFHAGRALQPGSRTGAGRADGRGGTQLHRHSVGGRHRPRRRRLDQVGPCPHGPVGSGRPPPDAVPGQPRLFARPGFGKPGLALRHPLAVSAVYDGARLAPLAASRTAEGRQRLLRRKCGVGARQLVRAGRDRTQIRIQLRPPELVRSFGGGASRGAGRRRPVRSHHLRQVPGRGRGRGPGPGPGVGQSCRGRCGPRRLYPMAERPRRDRGRFDRDAAGRGCLSGRYLRRLSGA